jgi:methionyl-tRNA synthetase
VTALDSEPAYERWWAGSDRRIHLIGKGVLRFHAVYWPAMLLSAGLPLPTDVLVHDYLTVDGQKISKSSGSTVDRTALDPVSLAHRFSADAVRWWLLREVPRVGDADFTVSRLVARANEDLAGGLGNLVNRVVSMIHRYRAGLVPSCDGGLCELDRTCAAAPGLIQQALDGFDFRRAAAAAWSIVECANREIERVRPWELARAGDSGRLDAVLGSLLSACRSLASCLSPFIPAAAALVADQCRAGSDARLPEACPLFPRLELPT